MTRYTPYTHILSADNKSKNIRKKLSSFHYSMTPTLMSQVLQIKQISSLKK